MRITAKRIRQALLVSLFTSSGFFLSSEALAAKAADRKPSYSWEQKEARLSHAQELLGRYYRRSIVRSGEEVRKINGFIYRSVRDSLPERFKNRQKEVAQAIIDEAWKREFDPVFLMAVIENESSFNPLAKGSLDEIGLMQLRPATAKWIAGLEGLNYEGDKTLRDPVMNIRIGAAYMAWLRAKFGSHARLYISAYNMGQNKVKEKLQDKVWPKEYTVRVMKYYVDFYERLREEQKDDIQSAQGSKKPIKTAHEPLGTKPGST